MKRLSFLLMLAAMFAFVSCGSSSEKKVKEVETEVEEVIDEVIEATEDAAEAVEETQEESSPFTSVRDQEPDQKDKEDSPFESVKDKKSSSGLESARGN